ncbi:hypothetical protein [Arthrobacter sp. U41]|uniref:hypothetical protein n=1 Tax=Arthrobacter sp. U41 TaxID=1849032 RepID=UPI0008594F40|nr:hypothetical protein [Arthrobacter sp. U41]AOT05728.1 hypothetical protein ASPU41_19925 [Arthrobacter sp. U41]
MSRQDGKIDTATRSVDQVEVSFRDSHIRKPAATSWAISVAGFVTGRLSSPDEFGVSIRQRLGLCGFVAGERAVPEHESPHLTSASP